MGTYVEGHSSSLETVDKGEENRLRGHDDDHGDVNDDGNEVGSYKDELFHSDEEYTEVEVDVVVAGYDDYALRSDDESDEQ